MNHQDRTNLGNQNLFLLDQVRAADSFHLWFDRLTWTVKKGEVWAVLGGNGSGKSLLSGLLRGELPMSSGNFHYCWAGQDTRPAVVSFESQKKIRDQLRWDDNSEFLEGGVDPGPLVRDFLGGENSWLGALGLEPVADRGLKLLSSGEFRKVLLARELGKVPPLLILDEPYEALDQEACSSLKTLWPRLPVPQLFLLQREVDIPDHATHLLILEAGRILKAGPRVNFSRGEIQMLLEGSNPKNLNLPDPLVPQASGFQTLIQMTNVRVQYGEKVVFQNFFWTVNPGDHWLITGPNGSGKTTLLSLINGENQQAFREDVVLFGRRRGTGETLWDIRRNQGVVSPSLHQDHDHSLDQPVWAIVAGGLFDTIGLYETLGWERRQGVQRWLEAFELGDLGEKNFQELSYGQQRLILLVRALVKEPPLLILDEPCQGLDTRHTGLFLEAVDQIAASGRTTVLFVTHREEERLACLKHHLKLPL